MVDQNSNEAMSDDEFERELRALLDVEPSPDFVARVRTDVHADAIADVWLTGRWIAVGAAAVVIVGVSAWMATRSTEPLTSPAAIVSQQVPSVPSVRSLAPGPSSAPQTAAPAARHSEVIVSPRNLPDFAISSRRCGRDVSTRRPCRTMRLLSPTCRS